MSNFIFSYSCTTYTHVRMHAYIHITPGYYNTESYFVIIFVHLTVKNSLAWDAIPTFFAVPNQPPLVGVTRPPPKKRKMATSVLLSSISNQTFTVTLSGEINEPERCCDERVNNFALIIFCSELI